MKRFLLVLLSLALLCGICSSALGDTFHYYSLTLTLPEGIAIQEADNYTAYFCQNGNSGIPYAAVSIYKITSYDHEKYAGFLEAFMEGVMQTGYEDLEIVSEAETVEVGGKQMRRLVCQYSIQDGQYTVVDTRLVWETEQYCYLFFSKEVPALDYTIGDLLTEIAGSAAETR